jgi:hypothetical protein
VVQSFDNIGGSCTSDCDICTGAVKGICPHGDLKKSLFEKTVKHG